MRSLPSDAKPWSRTRFGRSSQRTQVFRPAGLIEKAGLLVKPKGRFDVTQLQVYTELEKIRAGEG